MAASSLSDADLHALVDGPLDTSRRADLLRRAAASPRDRDLVETWQDQGEWIRDAFAGVEAEPVPPALDLGKVRHLQAVPFGAPVPPARTRPWRSTAATLAAMAIGLAASWYVAASPDAGAAKAPAQDEAGLAAAPLPTATIPDLSHSGFAFTGAERPQGGPATLVFHYRKGANERVDVGVRDAADAAATTGPEPVSWTSGGAAYTMSGSIAPDRLRALAATLKRDTLAQ